MKTKKVRVIAAPWGGWWYAVGEEHTVRPYHYQATDEATVTACHCADCYATRAGKQLYDMWEVVGGSKEGSILPRIHTEEQHNDHG